MVGRHNLQPGCVDRTRYSVPLLEQMSTMINALVDENGLLVRLVLTAEQAYDLH